MICPIALENLIPNYKNGDGDLFMTKRAKCEEILYYICQEQEPGKKMVQKLMYLMGRKGLNLGLNYSIHFYGPYSASLDDTLHALEAQGVINITVAHLTHKIALADRNNCPQVLSEEERDVVFEVLKCFEEKSAADLEAYTTLDYVAHTIWKDKGTEEQVIQDVLKIKSKKFSLEELQEKYQVMKQLNYIY